MTGRAGVLFVVATLVAAASTGACAGSAGAGTGASTGVSTEARRGSPAAEPASVGPPVPLNQTVAGTPSKEECAQYFKTGCACEVTVQREAKGGCRVTLGLSNDLITIDVSKRIPKQKSAVMCGRMVRCD